MARILVIDDSPTVVAVVRQGLAEQHEIERLSVFTQLASRLRQEPPDLILLDLNMPAMSGTNVAQFIRKAQPRPIPIIIYSSESAETMADAARQLNAAAYVAKSASLDELRREVQRALRPEASEPEVS